MPSKNKQKRGAGKRVYYRFTSGESPLNEFFAQYYPSFRYDPTESASHEFYRMCDEFEWDRDDPIRADAHQEFKDALVKQFNEVYGTDEDDPADWENLCVILQIDPIPDDLTGCREAVSGTYVNLVDLVDADGTGQVQIFDTELELSEYTRSTGKYFPKESAYAGGLLRYLLRHILHPSTEVSTSRRRNKRRR